MKVLVYWALWLGVYLLGSAPTYIIMLILDKLVKEAVEYF